MYVHRYPSWVVLFWERNTWKDKETYGFGWVCVKETITEETPWSFVFQCELFIRWHFRVSLADYIGGCSMLIKQKSAVYKYFCQISSRPKSGIITFDFQAQSVCLCLPSTGRLLVAAAAAAVARECFYFLLWSRFCDTEALLQSPLQPDGAGEGHKHA